MTAWRFRKYGSAIRCITGIIRIGAIDHTEWEELPVQRKRLVAFGFFFVFSPSQLIDVSSPRLGFQPESLYAHLYAVVFSERLERAIKRLSILACAQTLSGALKLRLPRQ